LFIEGIKSSQVHFILLATINTDFVYPYE